MFYDPTSMQASLHALCVQPYVIISTKSCKRSLSGSSWTFWFCITGPSTAGDPSPSIGNKLFLVFIS